MRLLADEVEQVRSEFLGLFGGEVYADPGVPRGGAVQPDDAFDVFGVDGAVGVSVGDECAVGACVSGFHASHGAPAFCRHKAPISLEVAA